MADSLTPLCRRPGSRFCQDHEHRSHPKYDGLPSYWETPICSQPHSRSKGFRSPSLSLVCILVPRRISPCISSHVFVPACPDLCISSNLFYIYNCPIRCCNRSLNVETAYQYHISVHYDSRCSQRLKGYRVGMTYKHHERFVR